MECFPSIAAFIHQPPRAKIQDPNEILGMFPDVERRETTDLIFPFHGVSCALSAAVNAERSSGLIRIALHTPHWQLTQTHLSDLQAWQR
jgi:hypothetical protein